MEVGGYANEKVLDHAKIHIQVRRDRERGAFLVQITSSLTQNIPGIN